MKIKEKTYYKLNAHSTGLGGEVVFKFNRKDVQYALAEVVDYINILNERNPNVQLNFSFSWYSNSAILGWWRILDEKEKIIVQKLLKKELESKEEKQKRSEFILAKKLAKKYKLIK